MSKQQSKQLNIPTPQKKEEEEQEEQEEEEYEEEDDEELEVYTRVIRRKDGLILQYYLSTGEIISEKPIRLAHAQTKDQDSKK